ncbi:glycosyltransferase [Nocardioides campestrisoli]|uniref:glycosyltransferase n=1 Tax=Nocardioides campestrisoli TaxID=2736757 RepID=UPI00163D5AE2|nr:glycosyltransferase [Nocardioides campestrisoli]
MTLESTGTVGTVGSVLFSAQDYWYHNRAHSDVQLARALSADRPVLLVNSLGMRMPRRGSTTQPLRRVARKLTSTLRALRRPEPRHPQLYVMTPISVPVFASPRLSRLNAWSVHVQVRMAARLVGIRVPDVLVTLPTAWEVARLLRSRRVVVNRSDRYSSLPEADSGLIGRLERSMLGACDAAVYVSTALMAEEQPLVRAGAGQAVLLGHGVDLAHFDPAATGPEPTDLAAVPHPRVGFFGGIDDYVVDLPLVRRLAEALPDVSVVLVGAATCPLDDLLALPNVHWLGMKSYDEIPRYGAGFDVAIMPWLQNDWIRFCNPVKTKEYLALGLPVVTTPYPEASAHLDVLAVAQGPDDFVAKVAQALAGESVGTPESRRASVLDDSWSSRADVLRTLFAGRED